VVSYGAFTNDKNLKEREREREREREIIATPADSHI
jgi:hypothetical protein